MHVLKNTFVTGGSGFLGRTLIAELRSRGIAVRALARSSEAEAAVRGQGAEPVKGGLDDIAALRNGMAGCDVVFHAAALLGEAGEAAVFNRVNVLGTEHVLTAARAAGVSRLAHVSSDAVLAGPAPILQANETAPKPSAPYGPYARTKGIAEDMVLAANAQDFTTVVVRPRFIWGKGDTSVLPKIMEAVRAGRFRWINGGRYLTSSTHVRNACEGLILAAERGRGGEVYFVTDGPPIEFRKFLESMLEAQNVRLRARSLPRPLARTIAAIVEGIWSGLSLKARPPVTRLSVKMMGEEVTLDDEKARRELGYVGLMSFEDGIREMRDASVADLNKQPPRIRAR